MNAWRPATAGLLAVAAVGTVVRIANSGAVGRVGGVLAALGMVVTAVAVVRAAPWSYGVAFLFGVCWFWAVVALRIQDVMAVGEFVSWLAWSVMLMVSAVRSRAA